LNIADRKEGQPATPPGNLSSPRKPSGESVRLAEGGDKDENGFARRKHRDRPLIERGPKEPHKGKGLTFEGGEQSP